jgi:hypothetical protein
MALDRSRIFAQRITVFGGQEDGRFPELPNIFFNTLPAGFLPAPTIEDFIMIDFMQRQGYPIASYFNRIRSNFNVDRQHQLLQRIYRMCFTIPVYQRAFNSDDGGFIERYFFADTFYIDEYNNDIFYPTVVYFSIESRL